MESKIVYDTPIDRLLILRTEIHEHTNKKQETKNYFSIRFWHETISGKFIPGRNGLTIEFKYFGEFEKAFKALQKEMITNHLEELDNPK